MELFFSDSIIGGSSSIELNREESRHCIKVLRHKAGDIINVIDGSGSLFKCRIISSAQEGNNQNGKYWQQDKEMCARKDSKHREYECNLALDKPRGKHSKSSGDNEQTLCTVEEIIPDFGSHPYHLTMAVAPTKNMDRYEWFLEKGTETGLDEIVPVICEHSERKDLNTERCRRILVSAIKQSLKGALPVLQEPVRFTDWLNATFPLGDSSTHSGYHNLKSPEAGTEETLSSMHGESPADLRLICYCGDEFPKQSITQALTDFFRTDSDENNNDSHSEIKPETTTESVEEPNRLKHDSSAPNNRKITIIIGPEGDFSQAEIECAMKHGFKAITLGPSRLRIESAALLSVNAVYLQSLKTTFCRKTH